jgi:excisionase family DNA binding protein
MKDSNSWLTPSQAAKLLNCTSRTVNNFITSGKLSASREDGRYYIDKSELFRVFPDAHKKELEKDPHYFKLEQERIKLENMMLKDAISDKEKEISFLRNQIEIFNKKESSFLDTIQSHTKLLEHKTSSSSKKQRWTHIFKRQDK